MTETLRRGYPGMKSVKDMPVVQDGPPPGGFPAVRYARRIPSTGPTGFTLFAVGAAVMAYGFYKVGVGNRKRNAEKQELLELRANLYPILQAMEDISFVYNKAHADAMEAHIMRNVPGWVPGQSVYSEGARWMPPARPAGVWGE